MEVIRLNANGVDEFIRLIEIFSEVFEMEPMHPPGREVLENLLRSDDFDAFVCMHNGKLIGGLTVYLLPQYYQSEKIAYIYDLAVLKEFQRKGAGTLLIKETRDYYRVRGIKIIYVQAEKADDYAVKFYRNTGPDVELEAVHFEYRF